MSPRLQSHTLSSEFDLAPPASSAAEAAVLPASSGVIARTEVKPRSGIGVASWIAGLLSAHGLPSNPFRITLGGRTKPIDGRQRPAAPATARSSSAGRPRRQQSSDSSGLRIDRPGRAVHAQRVPSRRGRAWGRREPRERSTQHRRASAGPFITVSCASMLEADVDAQLFGLDDAGRHAAPGRWLRRPGGGRDAVLRRRRRSRPARAAEAAAAGARAHVGATWRVRLRQSTCASLRRRLAISSMRSRSGRYRRDLWEHLRALTDRDAAAPRAERRPAGADRLVRGAVRARARARRHAACRRARWTC